MAKTKQSEVYGRIEFEHLGIGTLLKRYRLAVPINQREYAWTDQYVTDLLHDIGASIRENKPTYFLGTIVLTAGEEEDSQEVADGQQRLATTTILLGAIRDYFFRKNEKMLVRWVEDSFLFQILPEEKEISPRLTLNLDDNDYFKKVILSEFGSSERTTTPNKPSHQRILIASELAAKHVDNLLRSLGESEKVSHLTHWAKFIENNAKVIVLKVSDDLNAFVMFETLNDRGLKISQADLVKNYLFGQAGEKIADAQQKWAQMDGALETLDSMEDLTLPFLRHLLSSIHGLTPEREVFRTIKNSVKGRGGAIDFLGMLAERSNDYVAILNPEHTKWNSYHASIRNSIRTLNSLPAIPLRHVMLAVAKHFSPIEAERAFRLFIAWAVRFLVTGGGRGGRLEGAYADRAKEITDGDITTAKQLAEKMIHIVPSDAQFEAEFAVAQIPRSKLARYFLRALELKVKGSPEPEFIPNEDAVINLEHVLPANPSPDWGNIDVQTAQTYYQRLGNMVLLQASRNTAIANRGFLEKVPTLKASAYLLTSDVAAYGNWGLDEIDARQKKLASIAVKTWPIDVL